MTSIDVRRVSLRAAIITLVLAAIAVPVEVRAPRLVPLTIDGQDFVENIVGFVPVGLVLARYGVLRGILVAALLTVGAESAQLFMVDRDPSVLDVIANVVGTLLGIAAARRWHIDDVRLTADKRTGLVAAALAAGLLIRTYTARDPELPGPTVPGLLEADWRFEEQGQHAADSSGHSLFGTLHGAAAREPGVAGSAIELAGRGYVDFGKPLALRSTGSMTITAWTRSTAFPADDAAIVSSLHGGFGYQLDTTIDTGPRTVGFKLTNECGDLMARYGKTVLDIDGWHHLAGVYDGDAKTLHVYLDGRLDDGPLIGTVTARQRTGKSPVVVGARSRESGYEFTGSIDSVKIYSYALDPRSVANDMRAQPVDPDRRTAASNAQLSPCAIASYPDDARQLPVTAAALGALTALAALGLVTGIPAWGALAVSIAAAALLEIAIAATLTPLGFAMALLCALSGGLAIATSTRARRKR
jgi:hypothetical protein